MEKRGPDNFVTPRARLPRSFLPNSFALPLRIYVCFTPKPLRGVYHEVLRLVYDETMPCALRGIYVVVNVTSRLRQNLCYDGRFTTKHLSRLIRLYILMYHNNIKIKSYVSIIRYNKNNKKLSYIKTIKINTSDNTFHLTFQSELLVIVLFPPLFKKLPSLGKPHRSKTKTSLYPTGNKFPTHRLTSLLRPKEPTVDTPPPSPNIMEKFWKDKTETSGSTRTPPTAGSLCTLLHGGGLLSYCETEIPRAQETTRSVRGPTPRGQPTQDTYTQVPDRILGPVREPFHQRLDRHGRPFGQRVATDITTAGLRNKITPRLPSQEEGLVREKQHQPYHPHSSHYGNSPSYSTRRENRTNQTGIERSPREEASKISPKEKQQQLWRTRSMPGNDQEDNINTPPPVVRDNSLPHPPKRINHFGQLQPEGNEVDRQHKETCA
ncbi:hypothetical protein YC2023_033756 [Brassica napus]